MPDNVNALIAGFPETLQRNALAQGQQDLQQQVYAQNALKLQQQTGGLNALRNIYADQGNIDKATGLPRLGALGPLFTADPSRGLDFAELAGKLNDEQSRTALTQLRTKEYYAGLFEEGIVQPMLQFDQSLPHDISPEERAQKLATYHAELLKGEIAKNGVPESVADQWRNIPADPSRMPIWAVQSPLWQQRKEAVAKGWKDDNVDYGVTPPRKYSTNPEFYPGMAFESDHLKPYKPTSVAKPEFRPENYGGYWTDTYKDSAGKLITHPFVKGAGDQAFEVNPDSEGKQIPYTIRGTPKPDTSRGGASAVPKTVPLSVQATPGGKSETVWASEAPGETPGSPPVYTRVGGPQAGQVIDPKTITGIQTPTAANYPQYNENALNTLVEQAIAGDPSIYRSMWGAPQLRVQITNAIGDRAVAMWGKAAGANLAAINAMFQGQEGALRGLDRLKANVENFESTTLANMDNAEKLAVKGLTGGTSPVLNKVWNLVRKGAESDPNLIALDAVVGPVVSEYAKVMSSPGATGAVTTDEAVRRAAAILSRDFSPAGFHSAMQTMRVDMTNRINSINDQIGRTIKDIRQGGGVTEPLTPPETSRPTATIAAPRAAAVPIPKAYSDVPEGFALMKDNQLYVRRGGQLVPAKQMPNGQYVPLQ